MARELFIPRRFTGASEQTIAHISTVLDEYARKGFVLTARGLYYQFVSRKLFPSDRRWRYTGTSWVRDPKGTTNATPNYKWLTSLCNDARLAGLLDWDMIEDNVRNQQDFAFWDGPRDAVDTAARTYAEDLWATQKWRPWIWIEKDALINVVSPVCQRYRLPHLACRGYTSQSELYRAGKRLEAIDVAGQKPLILHLGDHDPSGLDMTRDNEERATLFARFDVPVERLALNMDQIEQYDPPPDPAKDTDTRAFGYKQRYGKLSWELDALDPQVINDLIAHRIERLLDHEAWSKAELKEAENRRLLQNVVEKWPEVVKTTKGGKNVRKQR